MSSTSIDEETKFGSRLDSDESDKRLTAVFVDVAFVVAVDDVVIIDVSS